MMKRILFFLTLTSLLPMMAMAQSGTLKGRVMDEHNLGLPGAVVLISTLEKGSISDQNGNFEMLKIPEGKHNVTISFMGYEDQSYEVEIKTGETTTLKAQMTPGILLGDEVLILGDRLKGQAKALNDQKNKMNITNVVAADQVGRFPDANVGDALKRISGITMQNDQGEARNIIVRGMAPQLNSVTINGERVPSAEGDNRNVQLDLIPSDMVQMIEVNKAVTPDMDADAIGGSINLITRSNPEGFRFSGTLATGFNFLSQKPIWTGAAVFGNRYLNNKLGVVLSGSYNVHDFGSDNVEAEWVELDGYGPIVDVLEIRQYQVKRTRRSFSLGLDYQINSNNTLYFNTIYNWRDDWENRYRVSMEDIADGITEEGATVVEPGVIETFATIKRQTKGGSDSERNNNARLEDQRTINMSLRGEHLIANKVNLDWSGTYSRASEQRPNERYIRYKSKQVPVRVDYRDARYPVITELSSDSWEETELDELTEEFQDQWEEDLNGKINLQMPISKNSVVKIGGTYRSKSKERKNTYSEFTPIGGTTEGEAHPDMGGSWSTDDEEYTDLFLNQIPTINKNKTGFLPGGQYKPGEFADKKFLGGLQLTNGNLYEGEDKPEEYVPGNYNADEVITAGYAMVDLQLSKKFSTIIGARVENTSVDYKGYAIDVEDNDVPITTRTGSNSYTNFLPGVHLKFDATEHTVLRMAWTNTLARPDYYKLVPFEEFNSEDMELVLGNADLKPTIAMNFDFMAENYFKSIGLVSAGFFYKDLNDFIYEKNIENFEHPTYGEVDLSTYDNGGKAHVTGFELAMQRQLNFLPGFMKGFGVYFNYTYTTSNTSGIEGREGEDLALPGTANNMLNASLSYETEKLVLRMSLNYASDYIDELGGEAFEDRYYDKQTFLDFNGSYAITPQWRLFAEVNNITNQPLRYYQGVQDRTMQMEYYNLRMNFGLKFDVFEK